jgi:hypothetical protein
MEPITLCGLIIVLFGLWVEFEPAIMKVVGWVRGWRVFTLIITQPVVPTRACTRKMQVCLAKRQIPGTVYLTRYPSYINSGL